MVNHLKTADQISKKLIGSFLVVKLERDNCSFRFDLGICGYNIYIILLKLSIALAEMERFGGHSWAPTLGVSARGVPYMPLAASPNYLQ